VTECVIDASNFHWVYEPDGKLWNEVLDNAKDLADLEGSRALWLPRLQGHAGRLRRGGPGEGGGGGVGTAL